MADHCQYRQRPSDALTCALLPEVGRDMCPRHAMMAAFKQQKKDQEDAAKAGFGRVPKSRSEMAPLDYRFAGSGQCKHCAAHIEWWKTPAGKNAPYNPMPELNSAAVSHFATCPRAAEFRRTG